MSLSSRAVRAATRVAPVVAAFAVVAPSASGAPLQQTCLNYPGGERASTIDVAAVARRLVYPTTPSPVKFDIATTGAAPSKAWLDQHYRGTATLAGSAKLSYSLIPPNGGTAREVEETLTLEPTEPGEVSTTVYATGSVETPRLGTRVSLVLNALTFSFAPLDAAGNAVRYSGPDYDVDWPYPSDEEGRFSVFCGLAEGQDREFASIRVGDVVSYTCEYYKNCPAPSPPRHVRVNAIGSTSARLDWFAAESLPFREESPFDYEIEVGGKTYTVSSQDNVSSLVLRGLRPATRYEGQIRTSYLGTSAWVPFAFTTGEGASSTVDFTATGNSTLPTLVRGVLPLRGGLTGAVDPSGAFFGNLTLAPATGRLVVAAGFRPVTAKIGFAQSGLATGELTEDGFSVDAKVRIKVVQAKLFGAIPIEAGNFCQTRQLTALHLASAGRFDPTAGGTLSGTFAISDLNGCGILEGLVSPLVAGSGNAISLTVAPRAIGTSAG